MKVVSLDIPDVKLIHPDFFEDERGHFLETYNLQRYREHGIGAEFVQDNQSLSKRKGTVRGLHFQAPPHAQGKLVRVISGSLLDVAVDLRLGSPYFGQYVSAELDADTGTQMWIPEGFAHGFLTLKDNTRISYKITDYYDPQSEGSLIWNDPDLDIDWGQVGDVLLSEKDRNGALFSEFDSPFKYPAG